VLICEIVFYRCGADAAKLWCSNANWRCSARERISNENCLKIHDICREKKIPLYDMRVKEWEPGFKLHVSTYMHWWM